MNSFASDELRSITFIILQLGWSLHTLSMFFFPQMDMINKFNTFGIFFCLVHQVS